MGRVMLIILALLGGSFTTVAGERPAKKAKPVFKVERHLFAHNVRVDKEGLCQASRGVRLKSWTLPDFPASIPPFESCTTIWSNAARSGVEIALAIKGNKGKTLLKVDGVIDLGSDGRASQAIDWDHLKVPSPGTYHLHVSIHGKEISRFPMYFKRKAEN